MNKGKGRERGKQLDQGRDSDEARPEVSIEGHDAAIRGTSVQPGEAGSKGTARGGSVGLTDNLDRYENEDGLEGRRGGENAAAEDVGGGTESDEFGGDGSPRGLAKDW